MDKISKAIKAVLWLAIAITFLILFGVCNEIQFADHLTAEMLLKYALCFIIIITSGIGIVALKISEDEKSR
jgi:hypothetical protein